LPTRQAGDFGSFDKKTGEFFVEENIYTHKDLADLANRHTISVDDEVGHYEIAASGVVRLSAEVDDGA
jgi:hypothetical protein